MRVLEKVLPEAEQHNVRLGLENVSILTPETSYIHTLNEALDVVEAVGSPYLGVTMEFNNAWIERGLYENLRHRHKWLTIAQVSDFRLGTFCTRQRVPVGDGVIPLRRMVHALDDAGYTGYYDIELMGSVIEEVGYANAIRRSVTAFKNLWD
jgi:sugar phosphate isomerase/epimerase